MYTGLTTPLDNLLSSNVWDKSVEAELGSPRFIVFTYKYKYVDGFDPVGAPLSEGDVTTRQVWEGNFRYTNNRLVSARLQRVSFDSLHNSTWIDNSIPPSTRFSGFVSKTANNTGGISISDPDSLSSWADAVVTLTGGGSGEIQSRIADAYYGTSTPFHTAAESEAGVRSYQSGRFFSEGWWNNPFQPDLI